MTTELKETTADFIDKFMQRTTIGVFLIAVAYGLDALMELKISGLSTELKPAQLIVTIIAIAFVLPQFIKMVRLRNSSKGKDCEPESFVVEAYKKAAEKAFSYTFIILIIMDFVVSLYFSHIPPEFFIKLILSLSLFTFSLSFFILNRDGDEEDDDFGED